MCGRVRGQEKIPMGLNVVYFPLQDVIVFACAHHMTPGHSLPIRAVLNPLNLAASQRPRTQMHTMGRLLSLASEREASPPE